ncbi:SET domain-containing protein 5 [Echria macrotheca]|uniref:SET domain-containing protein 5 n=1 Tax=Echria macrotheca TaxID=438768 RepID=A0AAJ0BCB6_9PEZI|nr:SET domain-containing protein 5 [Echria macrotheca]
MAKLTTLLTSCLLVCISTAGADDTQKHISWTGCLPGPFSNDDHPPCEHGSHTTDTPDDYSPSEFRPWTHRPICPDETPYCVHTDASFHDRGLSVIAIPYSKAKSLNETTPIRSIEILLASNALGEATPELSVEPEDKPYEIRDIPGKGKGMVAVTKIPRGTVLMVEYVAVLADMVFPTRVKRSLGREMLRRAMDRLGDEQRDLILGLARSSSTPGSVPAAEDIMRTNSFTISVAGKSQMGLFPRIARINHSCKPSAIIKFDEQTLSMTVRTIRDIEPGEEVTLSYADFGLSFHERQRTLKAKWGFECTCELCSAPPDEIARSDARRKKITQLGAEVVENLEEYSFEAAVGKHREMMEVIEEEALAPHMGDYYEVMTRLLAASKNIKEAKKYARLAIAEFELVGEKKEELEAFLKVA